MDIRIFEMSSDQRRWLERNVKNYDRNVTFPVDRVFYTLVVSIQVTFITIVGDKNPVQIIIGPGGLSWQSLGSEDSSTFYEMVNNFFMGPLPDSAFNTIKKFITAVNNQ